jgi:hypothetical protein
VFSWLVVCVFHFFATSASACCTFITSPVTHIRQRAAVLQKLACKARHLSASSREQKQDHAAICYHIYLLRMNDFGEVHWQ